MENNLKLIVHFKSPHHIALQCSVFQYW